MSTNLRRYGFRTLDSGIRIAIKIVSLGPLPMLYRSKISWKFVHKFASNPTDRQTDRQTDKQTDRQNRPDRKHNLLFFGGDNNNQCWNWPKRTGVIWRNVWNFTQGLKFLKPIFTQKMSVC